MKPAMMLFSLLATALYNFKIRRFKLERIEPRGNLSPGAWTDHNRNGLMNMMLTDPDRALYLLQLVTGYELGLAREALARGIALREIGEGGSTLEDLVKAWKTEPELTVFADAVAVATLARSGDQGRSA